MSVKPAKRRPKPPAEEFFYLDDGHKKADAELHEPILAAGDDAAAKAVSDAVRERILGTGSKKPVSKSETNG